MSLILTVFHDFRSIYVVFSRERNPVNNYSILNKLVYAALFCLFCLYIPVPASAKTMKLEYELYFQGIPGGRAEMAYELKDTTVSMLLTLRTNRFTDRLFRIRDTIRVTARTADYSLISVEKKINEGRYSRDTTFYAASIPPDSLDAPIRDEYCAMMMLMDESYFRYSRLNLNLYAKGREFPMDLNEIHREDLHIAGTSMQGILYRPDEEKLNAVSKKKTVISVWMANFLPSVPLQIQLEFKIGTVILKLLDLP